MANPEGRVLIDKAEAQQAAKHYAQMEAELQALKQRNEEIMRDLQEAQSVAATEHVRVDRRSRVQTHEFATLTAELLAKRQEQGPQVQFQGMCFGIKVEKPTTYDGDKGQDLDTWLFQEREHLDLATIPATGHVAYATSLL